MVKYLNKHTFELYEAIEDLPITQFHKYSKFLLVEGGIGDSIQDIDAHITKILQFLKTDVNKAHQEILNMRQCIYMVANELDIHNKATLCLVKSVDGKPWTNFSDSGIEALYKMVGGAKVKEFNEIRNIIQEKIDRELKLYFPKIFENSVEKNYTDLLRKRAMLQLSEMIDGEDNKEAIEKVTNEIMSRQNPKNFEGSESEEIKFDKQFEDMCLAMSKEFGGMVKGYSVMEFYSAYSRLDKQQEEIKKRLNKKK